MGSAQPVGRPFLPGPQWTGNAKGRPPNTPQRSILVLIREKLDAEGAIDAKTGKPITGAEAAADAFFARILEGDAVFWAMALKHMPHLFLPDRGASDPEPEQLEAEVLSLGEKRAQLDEFVRILEQARYLSEEASPPADTPKRPNGGANGGTMP